MLTVVSGQIVVHSESVNARMTTLPRNWLRDIGWPNWLTSRNPGAARPPSEDPGSRSGLAAAVRACPVSAWPVTFPVPSLALHAATASSPARTPIRNGIRSRLRPALLLLSTAAILPSARTAAARVSCCGQPMPEPAPGSAGQAFSLQWPT